MFFARPLQALPVTPAQKIPGTSAVSTSPKQAGAFSRSGPIFPHQGKLIGQKVRFKHPRPPFWMLLNLVAADPKDPLHPVSQQQSSRGDPPGSNATGKRTFSCSPKPPEPTPHNSFERQLAALPEPENERELLPKKGPRNRR